MSSSPLSICYLLEDTTLFGGVKVLLHQANLLARRGHRVILASKGAAPDWYPVEAELVEVAEHRPGLVPRADITVATFWTTLRRAQELPDTQVLHYCQGYEGLHTHNVADHPEIEALYRQPLPAMVVSPHLREMLASRYRRPSRMAPPPLAPEFFQGTGGSWLSWISRRRGPRTPARILVVAPWEMYLKGVPVAVRAVRELRRRGIEVQLVRLSQWPLSAEERGVMEPDEFHLCLPPHEVPALVEGCDLLLAPSWEAEGFGLPTLEAMACGVPAITSEISSYRTWAQDAVLRVEGDDPLRWADAAEHLLTQRKVWRRQRRAGLQRARDYRESRAADLTEEALSWVASGAWQLELEALRGAPPASAKVPVAR
ncbi:MAG: glycosyltransferase [Acidobacteriota bacterium]